MNSDKDQMKGGYRFGIYNNWRLLLDVECTNNLNIIPLIFRDKFEKINLNDTEYYSTKINDLQTQFTIEPNDNHNPKVVIFKDRKEWDSEQIIYYLYERYKIDCSDLTNILIFTLEQYSATNFTVNEKIALGIDNIDKIIMTVPYDSKQEIVNNYITSSQEKVIKKTGTRVRYSPYTSTSQKAAQSQILPNITALPTPPPTAVDLSQPDVTPIGPPSPMPPPTYVSPFRKILNKIFNTFKTFITFCNKSENFNEKISNRGIQNTRIERNAYFIQLLEINEDINLLKFRLLDPLSFQDDVLCIPLKIDIDGIETDVLGVLNKENKLLQEENGDIEARKLLPTTTRDQRADTLRSQTQIDQIAQTQRLIGVFKQLNDYLHNDKYQNKRNDLIDKIHFNTDLNRKGQTVGGLIECCEFILSYWKIKNNIPGNEETFKNYFKLTKYAPSRKLEKYPNNSTDIEKIIYDFENDAYLSDGDYEDTRQNPTLRYDSYIKSIRDLIFSELNSKILNTSKRIAIGTEQIDCFKIDDDTNITANSNDIDYCNKRKKYFVTTFDTFYTKDQTKINSNFQSLLMNCNNIITKIIEEDDKVYKCCYICGKKMDRDLNVDHIIPLKMAYIFGLTTFPLNFTQVHAHCNKGTGGKGEKVPDGITFIDSKITLETIITKAEKAISTHPKFKPFLERAHVLVFQSNDDNDLIRYQAALKQKLLEIEAEIARRAQGQLGGYPFAGLLQTVFGLPKTKVKLQNTSMNKPGIIKHEIPKKFIDEHHPKGSFINIPMKEKQISYDDKDLHYFKHQYESQMRVSRIPILSKQLKQSSEKPNKVTKSILKNIILIEKTVNGLNSRLNFYMYKFINDNNFNKTSDIILIHVLEFIYLTICILNIQKLCFMNLYKNIFNKKKHKLHGGGLTDTTDTFKSYLHELNNNSTNQNPVLWSLDDRAEYLESRYLLNFVYTNELYESHKRNMGYDDPNKLPDFIKQDNVGYRLEHFLIERIFNLAIAFANVNEEILD
jgi:hypothetical protein